MHSRLYVPFIQLHWFLEYTQAWQLRVKLDTSKKWAEIFQIDENTRKNNSQRPVWYALQRWKSSLSDEISTVAVRSGYTATTLKLQRSKIHNTIVNNLHVVKSTQTLSTIYTPIEFDLNTFLCISIQYIRVLISQLDVSSTSDYEGGRYCKRRGFDCRLSRRQEEIDQIFRTNTCPKITERKYLIQNASSFL